MQIQLFLTLYALSIPIFLLGDFLWLGFIAKNFYQDRIGHLMGEVNWIAAVIFYSIFLIGLTLFATYPAATKGTVATALVLGALFGFFTYATYDLTNLATLKNWPLSLAIVDILWGTFLGAFVAASAVMIKNLIA
jgi:uncharacterized membrane protein